MTILTVAQATDAAYQAGFSDNTGLAIIVAIAQAESGLDTNAVNRNDPNGGSYGILQINAIHFGIDIPGSCAMDAFCSFRYAWLLSKGGTDFSPWGSYTNGTYKQFLSGGSPPQGGTPQPSPGVTETIAALFQKVGLIAWWTEPHVNFFGQNGEQGQDYGMTGGLGSPVGAITGGQVVYVGNGGYPGSSIGNIVQVLTGNGALVHYQHLKDANVTVGQTITPGTVIGSSGGCPVGCYPADPHGACTCFDNFSAGNHIEVRFSSTYKPGDVWGQNWTNPLSIFSSIAQQTTNQLPIITSGLASLTGGAPLIDFSWLTNSALWQWLTDPARMLKVTAGVMLVGLALLMLIMPEAEQVAKVAAVAA